MHFRDALRVLWHGLPPPTVKVEVHTDTIIVPENAEFIPVFRAEAGGQRRYATRDFPWDGGYFRSCAEAFKVCGHDGVVQAESAYVRGDTILLGGFTTKRFYEPPPSQEIVGDPFIEGSAQ